MPGLGDPDEQIQGAEPQPDRGLVQTYRFLQLSVGVIAILLPFVPAVGAKVIDGEGLRGSISSYYYTSMGGFFVGSLCAMGVIFVAYRHKATAQYKRDNLATNVAGVLSVLAALFPTASEWDQASDASLVMATFHWLAAGALLLVLAYMPYYLFTKTDDPTTMTPKKARRNRIYRSCGVIVAVAVAMIVVSNCVGLPDSWHATFWLESVAVIAFAVSWLVKSDYISPLADA